MDERILDLKECVLVLRAQNICYPTVLSNLFITNSIIKAVELSLLRVGKSADKQNLRKLCFKPKRSKFDDKSETSTLRF